MILWDALVWLAIAKIAVMLFEDAAYAARGKRSPRMEERARRRDAEAAGGAGDRPAAAWARTRAAAGDYLAGLAEDGASAARAGRRRRRARKRGRLAVDGVLVDVDDDDRWYADCDTCGWSSRPFQLEANAKRAGAEHARTHRDDADDTPADDQPVQKPVQKPAPKPAPAAAARPRLTVLPGGATGPAGSAEPAGPTSTVVHDDHTYCPGCRTCRPGGFVWRCHTCQGWEDEFDTEAAARAAGARHVCPGPPATDPTTSPAGSDADPAATTDPAGDPPAGSNPTGDAAGAVLKEKIVDLEAAGPDEIRAAFATAVEAANEQAEEASGFAGVMTEAADRFESLEMAASTVGHIRDAADQFNAAQAALQSAAEELEAALADFNSVDGAVAETVADAGNLASREVLVG